MILDPHALLLGIADALERDAALAARLRAALGASGRDDLLDRAAVESQYPITFRVLSDAARRGEILIEHIGRKPVVRRSAVEAFAASRQSRPVAKVAKVANDTATPDQKFDAYWNAGVHELRRPRKAGAK